ncbi:MAG TPA: molybdopterin molybdotransferase MoeA [Methanocorpusculum sp.]|nr:molybdopterin molybdotransferase MoeA [Methanocorpusculum sp.]
MQKIFYSEASALVRSVPPSFTVRRMPIAQAVGKILAEPVFAQYNVPPAPVSAMDGFAVTAKDTAAASENSPVMISSCEQVNTGNVVRPPFDAVIMIEDVKLCQDSIQITAPVEAGRNVRATAEDIRKNGLVLPAGVCLRSFDIGAAAGYGITEVAVMSVRAGIIPTGTELVSPGCVPKPGEVVESNSIMAEAYLKEFGVDVTCYSPVSDDAEKIRAALIKAVAENDMVLISAGSSMGTRDFTSSVIEELGDLKFHGVFMKPAKPSMLGIVENKPVIGMPGFPLAAQTTLRMLVRPMFEAWGLLCPPAPVVSVIAGSKIKSEDSIDEFRFASVGKADGKIVALAQARSASMQMSAIRANAYLHIPRGTAIIEAGDSVDATLNVPFSDIGRTVLFGGVCTQGAEKLTESAASRGYFIRFGEAGTAELEKGFCHGIVSQKPVEEFDSIRLCDGSYINFRRDSKEAKLIMQFAGEF